MTYLYLLLSIYVDKALPTRQHINLILEYALKILVLKESRPVVIASLGILVWRNVLFYF